jgi:hypothetical protein
MRPAAWCGWLDKGALEVVGLGRTMRRLCTLDASGRPAPASAISAISMISAAVIGAVLLVGPIAPAHAQASASYEVAAYEAQEIASHQDLAAILWAYLGSCDSIENDFGRRQCQSLRAARRAQLAGKTFRMAGDRLALSALDFDDKKKTLELRLYGCIACSAAVTVEGQPLYVLGTGQATIFGTTVLGPVVHSVARKFQDQAAADLWKRDVVPRARAELVFRIPATPEELIWKRDLTQGVFVEIVGYRIHDPCTGQVIAAQPKSKPVAKDPSTCTGEDLVALQRAREVAARPKDQGPKGPVLPEALTPVDIQETLKPAVEAAQQCYAIYGVAGEARFRIKINGNGQVTEVDQEGYFVDTPTGDCIDRAIRAVTFPRTQKASTTVNYPFVLR